MLCIHQLKFINRLAAALQEFSRYWPGLLHANPEQRLLQSAKIGDAPSRNTCENCDRMGRQESIASTLMLLIGVTVSVRKSRSKSLSFWTAVRRVAHPAGNFLSWRILLLSYFYGLIRMHYLTSILAPQRSGASRN